MRFWISRNSEITIKEQIYTQVMLAIVSRDLKPGAKLPSVREMARRYRINQNTVSAAYQELFERGWVDFKKGSGIYVRRFEIRPPAIGAREELDGIIASLLARARDRGYSLHEIRERIRQWLEEPNPDHFLVIDPDPALRHILAFEIAEQIGFPVREYDGSPDAKIEAEHLASAFPIALHSQAGYVTQLLPTPKTCFYIETRSVTETLRDEAMPEADVLITVVSRWPQFLRWARTILRGAGVDEDRINFLDAFPFQPDHSSSVRRMFITDTLTARDFQPGITPRIFRVVSDESMTALRSCAINYLIRRGAA